MRAPHSTARVDSRWVTCPGAGSSRRPSRPTRPQSSCGHPPATGSRRSSASCSTRSAARTSIVVRPPHRLILSTRVQPDLPVALLRVRGDLAEIGVEELRFTPEDVDEFLRNMSVEGPEDLAAALAASTGGWPAGISQSVVSAQRTADPVAYLTGTSTRPTVTELLRSEVLAVLPESTRELLVRTSFLDTLTPGLCDAVMGTPGSAVALRGLAASETFVIRVDGPGEFYRLHQVLSDLLRSDLEQLPHDEVMELHRRASRWFEDRGSPAGAIEFALSSGDPVRAMDLVVAHSYTLCDSGELDVAKRALRRYDPQWATDPHRALDIAEALAFTGLAPPMLEVLASVDRWPTSDPTVLGRRSVLRCILHSFGGDLPAATAAMADVELHLGRLPDDELGLRTRLNWGRCLRLAGQLEDAESSARQVMAERGREPDTAPIMAQGVLAEILLDLGRLDEAEHLAGRALADWNRRGTPVAVGICDALRALAAIATERGRPEEAQGPLEDALRMAAHTRPGSGRALVLLALARAAAHRHEADRADAHLAEVRMWWRELSPGPQARHAYLRTAFDVALTFGNVDRAAGHLDELEAVGDAFACPVAPMLRARLHLAQGRPSFADRRDDELCPTIPVPLQIEMLLTDADLRFALSDETGADAAVGMALALGLPAGFRATFARSAAVRRTASRLEPVVAGTPLAEVVALFPGPTQYSGIPAPVALTAKELQVLQLLPTHLSYAGMAATLFVSVNTVKFHVKKVYAKLGVGDRSGAVTRARELGMLPPVL